MVKFGIPEATQRVVDLFGCRQDGALEVMEIFFQSYCGVFRACDFEEKGVFDFLVAKAALEIAEDCGRAPQDGLGAYQRHCEGNAKAAALVLKGLDSEKREWLDGVMAEMAEMATHEAERVKAVVVSQKGKEGQHGDQGGRKGPGYRVEFHEGSRQA